MALVQLIAAIFFVIVIAVIAGSVWWCIILLSLSVAGYLIYKQQSDTTEESESGKRNRPTSQSPPHTSGTKSATKLSTRTNSAASIASKPQQNDRTAAKPATATKRVASTRTRKAQPTAAVKRADAKARTATPKKTTKPEASSRNTARRKSSMFAQALLTRSVGNHLAMKQVFTAVDLETTGLDGRTDRIVEIGLVKFTGDGTILDEFVTLINAPGSSEQARAHHQINDADLTFAPSINSVLPEVFAFMTGTVVVAHNLDFEDAFLSAAARRAKVTPPPLTGLCTLKAARRQLDGRAYSLLSMHKTATGEWPKAKHTALGDARSVREVLLWMINSAPTELHLTEITAPVAAATFSTPCAVACRPMPMRGASIAALLESFPQSDIARAGNAIEINRYMVLLDECVDDGILTYDEAERLSAQALRTGITGTQLRALHLDAWTAAFADDAPQERWTALKPARRQEMALLAHSLGLADLAGQVRELIADLAEPAPDRRARYLRGTRVGIAGSGVAFDELRIKAEGHGADVAKRITKTVVWLATDAPETNDTHHRAARTAGVPMCTVKEANKLLDAAIAAVEQRAAERQREADRWAAEGKRQDDYWRPRWRRAELDYDPDPNTEWDD